MFGKKESPAITLVKSLAVPALTVIGSSVAAYFGARKGVSDTVEECAEALQKVVPTFEGLINKAEEAANAAPAAPAASDDEVAKYKEAIKKLMADNAALKNAAAQPAEAKAEAPKAEAPEAPKAEAPKADAPEAPKKEKKEKKAEVNAEAEAK